LFCNMCHLHWMSEFLSHNCRHQRLHNLQLKDVTYKLAPLEDMFRVHMHMGLISYTLR
jgi:hypothetical protein